MRKLSEKKEIRLGLYIKNPQEEIKIFCEMQSNFSDTVRYLIEEEIKRNGIRNLQEYIPATRFLPSDIEIVSTIDEYRKRLEEQNESSIPAEEVGTTSKVAETVVKKEETKGNKPKQEKVVKNENKKVEDKKAAKPINKKIEVEAGEGSSYD